MSENLFLKIYRIQLDMRIQQEKCKKDNPVRTITLNKERLIRGKLEKNIVKSLRPFNGSL